MLPLILRIAGIVLIVLDFYLFRNRTKDINTVYQYDKPEDKIRKQEAYEAERKRHDLFSPLKIAGILLFVLSFVIQQ